MCSRLGDESSSEFLGWLFLWSRRVSAMEGPCCCSPRAGGYDMRGQWGYLLPWLLSREQQLGEWDDFGCFSVCHFVTRKLIWEFDRLGMLEWVWWRLRSGYRADLRRCFLTSCCLHSGACLSDVHPPLSWCSAGDWRGFCTEPAQGFASNLQVSLVSGRGEERSSE